MSKPYLWAVPFLAVAACGGDDNSESAQADTGDAEAPTATFETCDVPHIFAGDIRPAPGEFAAAVKMKGNRIVSVIADGEAINADPSCIHKLADGAVAFSGLTDGHAHLLGIGLREMTLNLEGTASVAELLDRLASAQGDAANESVVYGRGWIETGWPEGRMPMASDLDQVISDRPVILGRADGHAVVVNTAALQAANITDDTPDPDGGRIVRDEAGKATGILIDNAEMLVMGLLPKLTEERRRVALKRGAEVYAAKGWTGIHNMSVDFADDAILRDLAAGGDLPLRVMNYFNPGDLDKAAATGRNCTDDLMVCTMGIKFYVDGALGSRGALLFEPYTDEPSTSGLQLMSGDEAKSAYRRAMGAGLQVTTHAIGDRGNDLVLEWYNELLSDDGDMRWRIEHAQIVRPEDIGRFTDAGIIASMQPSHAIGDLFFAPDRLGDARLDGAYAWQSMIDAGVRVIGGSDAPVEQGDPRIEFHAATRRTALDGRSGDDWRPEEAISPGDALALFTTAPAYGVFLEDQLGRLAPGYRADLTVLSADPATTPWSEIEVLMTVVDGKIHTP